MPTIKRALPVLLIALICVSAVSAQYKTTDLSQYKTLNESVKAVLGSILESLGSFESSDLSDDVQLQDNVTAYNPIPEYKQKSDSSDASDSSELDYNFDDIIDLSGLFAEPEDQEKTTNQDYQKAIAGAGKIIEGLFGTNPRIINDLIERVSVTVEDVFEQADRVAGLFDNFSLDNVTTTKGVKNVLSMFDNLGGFEGLVTDVFAKMVNGAQSFAEDVEYIVNEGKNKYIKEENDEEEVENANKIKDPLSTISFIKSKLGKKLNKEEKVGKVRNGDKVLRRQNALKAKDFEDYFNQQKENRNMNTVME